MAESLEDLFEVTSYKRRMNLPEGALFTEDGETIYKLVSQNGDANEMTCRPLSLQDGKVVEGPEEKVYKYGPMVYVVEEIGEEEEE